MCRPFESGRGRQLIQGVSGSMLTSFLLPVHLLCMASDWSSKNKPGKFRSPGIMPHIFPHHLSHIRILSQIAQDKIVFPAEIDEVEKIDEKQHKTLQETLSGLSKKAIRKLKNLLDSDNNRVQM